MPKARSRRPSACGSAVKWSQDWQTPKQPRRARASCKFAAFLRRAARGAARLPPLPPPPPGRGGRCARWPAWSCRYERHARRARARLGTAVALRGRACRARALAALWRAHEGRQRVLSLQKAWHGRPCGEWAQRTGCIGARASRERREFAGLLAACASCAEAIVPQRCALGGRKAKPLYDDSWEAAAATAHGARKVNSADVPEI